MNAEIPRCLVANCDDDATEHVYCGSYFVALCHKHAAEVRKERRRMYKTDCQDEAT